MITLYPSVGMTNPHPRLIPLLEKHEITYDLFCKKGRPPKGVREKRSAIVTELHAAGTSWADMMEITGLSNGAIQRLTKAMWNKSTRSRVKEQGRRVGASWKGKKRPGQLERQWADGVFDFHRGRVRPEEERQRLKDGWTVEARQANGDRHRELWADPEYRAKMVAYHRQPDVRAERSRAQTRRMEENPTKWARGNSEWVDTPKGTADRVFVRSSYEKAAVAVLEADPTVVKYKYEPVFRRPCGKWCKPDFLVTYEDGTQSLVEVKASWVLAQPITSKHRRKLAMYAELAAAKGLPFEVWTEVGVLKDVV